MEQRKAWNPTIHRNHLIRDAIGLGIYDCMKTDPSIYLFGEGASMKMHFDCPAIESEFPDRIITLPISEDGNTNFAVGASLGGVKPVVDVITSDFLFRTMDSICNTAPKVNFVTETIEEKKTIVIRSENITFGLTTGQRLESLFTHIPGLNVVYPSIPKDARALMRTALRHPGVTLFFEDRMIADSDTRAEDTEDTGQELPLGKARVVHEASGLTVVSYALTLQRARKVIEANPSLDVCELVDLRSLYPLDINTIRASVRKTGRLLIIEPDVKFAGVGAEVLAQLAESSDIEMTSKPYRLGSPKTMIPASHFLHDEIIPSEDLIKKVILERLKN
jgi:pyruvate/2-oxoglutarate/acetoin dehydrogenase E1 component